VQSPLFAWDEQLVSSTTHTHTHTSTYMSATWVWQGRTYGMGTRKAVLLGLARTVYMHRIWPYIWGVPCQKYRIYTVYIWYWPTLCVTWIRKRKRKEKEKEKLRRQWKSLPALIKEKEPCPYQTCPFQYCYQLSTGAGLRPSLQPSWFPLISLFLFAVEELYNTRYQSSSFSLINVGSGFHCMRSFLFFLF